MSVEVPDARVSVRPEKGSRLNLSPSRPFTDPLLAPVGLWL